MTSNTYQRELLATVDARELSTIRWGPLREMFPAFVEEIELRRYLKKLLAADKCRAVQIEPHREPDGRGSTHVFDVVVLRESPSTS